MSKRKQQVPSQTSQVETQPLLRIEQRGVYLETGVMRTNNGEYMRLPCSLEGVPAGAELALVIEVYANEK